VDPSSIVRGTRLETVLFTGRRKPMTTRDMHVALEPIIRRWISAACTWDEAAIGDYRFVIFSMNVAPDTQVYVQFWSEPLEPVVWEVSSGRWNPPTDEWLRGERSRRIEAMGFTIGGEAENYERLVEIDSAAEVAATAKTVVRILTEVFEYRGTLPIHTQLVYEGRSETNDTYDSFTPEDIAKVFAGLGFRVEKAVTEPGEPEEPRLRCRKRGAFTVVEFDERVDDENLYRRVRLSADLEISHEATLTMSTVLPFGGGVTLGWLLERIAEWEHGLKEQRRAARKDSSRTQVADSPGTVH
jgi:hypothetical protein